EPPGLVCRGERHAAGVEQALHRVVDVQACGRLHDASGELTRLLLGGDDDRVGGAVQRHAVALAVGRCIGEGRIDWLGRVGEPEAVENRGHALLDGATVVAHARLRWKLVPSAGTGVWPSATARVLAYSMASGPSSASGTISTARRIGESGQR